LRSERRTLLAFDTSAARCAAVLLSGGRVAANRHEPMDRGQAERLLPMLEEVLGEAGVPWTDLDAVAVCTGPGNFTGCRIGVAAARGLAFGPDVPAIGVSLFEALAEAAARSVVACYTDRKGQVFVQAWAMGAPLAPPTADLAAARSNMPGGALCVGSGRALAAATLGLEEGPEITAPDLVAALARAAERRADTPQPPPAPLYLRPPDAALPAEPAPVTVDDA